MFKKKSFSREPVIEVHFKMQNQIHVCRNEDPRFYGV